jgi:hypothetical protein
MRDDSGHFDSLPVVLLRAQPGDLGGSALAHRMDARWSKNINALQRETKRYGITLTTIGIPFDLLSMRHVHVLNLASTK